MGLIIAVVPLSAGLILTQSILRLLIVWYAAPRES